MSEGHTGGTLNGGQHNGSFQSAGQTKGDRNGSSSLHAQRILTQAALKLAEQSEQESIDLELESQEVEQQYHGLKRAAEAEVRKEIAKKRSIEIRRKIAEIEKDKSKVHQETVSENVSTSSRNQTPITRKPSMVPRNTVGLSVHEQHSFTKPSGAPKNTAVNIEASKSQATGENQDAVRKKRGDWSETQAQEVLGGYLERPLIQATLNFFETFLTEYMLKELADVLKSHPQALTDLRVLKAWWGGNSRDYFEECAKWTTARKVRRTSKWNRYYHQGFIRRNHGGPPGTTIMTMSLDDYKKTYQRELFGYRVQSKNNKDGQVDPLSLSPLYQAFLRTEHATHHPCDSHRMKILGESDHWKSHKPTKVR